MSPAGWLAGYAVVTLVAAATVFWRREPSLLRGRSAFLFTIGYLVVAATAQALTGAPVPAWAIVVAAILTTLVALAAPWWFVIGGPRADVVSTLEVCLGRVCAIYERTDEGFVMAVPAGGLHIRVHAMPWTRISLVTLRANPPHKKSDLLRQLFRKQYRGVLPTLTIRLG